MDLHEMVRVLAALQKRSLGKLVEPEDKPALKKVLAGKGTAHHLPLVASIFGVSVEAIQAGLLTPVELHVLDPESRARKAELLLQLFCPGYTTPSTG